MANISNMDFGSGSEDEGDFNPGAEVASDNGAASDTEQPAAKSSKPKSRRRSPPADSEPADDDDNEVTNGAATRDQEDEEGDEEQQDEDEDEEGEDEDDDDEVVDRPRKRARRDRRNQYIDIEAEVDDEDDEDEGDDDENDKGFIAGEHPDDFADLPPGAEADDRRHRELDRKREREQQMDAEKQAEILKERYGRTRREATDTAFVPKRLLLPGVEDPSIWGVRCKPGKEREVVFSILKRVEERMFSKNPMPITSAFERGGTAMVGYVYVEARKAGDVLAALEGIMNVYPRTKQVLVPIKEMPDLLRVVKSKELQQGGYVRIKRGKYAGDLAQVDDVETNGLEVTLRIIPRLDYGLNDDINGPLEAAEQKRKRGGFGSQSPALRPPQRLFSEAEAKKKHSKFLQSQSTFDKKHWIYMNDEYVNGFLIKEFKLQHLETENVNPTLEEVTRFAAGDEDGTENLDLTALAASLKNNSSSDSYLPGDVVEVYEGEQQGVTGTATAVVGEIVSLTVTEGELRGQKIDVPTKGLRKRFKTGDHVKVIGGSRYKDEVGMVVRIKDDRVTILSDMSLTELHVFSKDLRKASDSGMAGGFGRYDIHDLVQLDPSTVGCIIKVDRESLRVLDQNGAVKTVIPSQISNKIERRKNAVATDRTGAEIRTDDTVRESGGDQKQGVILHIHRSFLFLYNREQTENSGIFVARATNVATVAAKGGRVAQQQPSGPDLMKMNPALQRNGNGPGGAMPPPKSFGRDKAIGQTVTVRKGPYKGLLGIIKDTTDLEARVELHTKGKTIQISKDVLSFKDPITGNSMDYSSFSSRGRGRGGGGQGGFGGGATPRRPAWGDSGGRTPSAGGAGGGRTPAWGAAPSRTPAWSGGGGGGYGGGKTPRWGQDSGGKTPAWGADGGRTAYGGAGGRTPAWGADGSRTSYGGSNDYAGSRTPAYDSSSRTPAYNQSSSSSFDPWAKPQDAPTPAAPSAPTPSNPYSAPTPAAAAATPKYSAYGMDAPTPAGAPTPFAGNPETPAWVGDDGDDGPRYDDAPDTP